jgi:hypothetical protein
MVNAEAVLLSFHRPPRSEESQGKPLASASRAQMTLLSPKGAALSEPEELFELECRAFTLEVGAHDH